MSGFRIHPEVAEDIAEAANWYDERDIPAWASDLLTLSFRISLTFWSAAKFTG